MFGLTYAQADIPADYAEITAGLSGATFNTTATQTGSIAMFGKSAFPILLSETTQYAVCAAGRYNDSYEDTAGRAMAFGHKGWLLPQGNNGALLENSIKWVTRETSLSGLRVFYSDDLDPTSSIKNYGAVLD